MKQKQERSSHKRQEQESCCAGVMSGSTSSMSHTSHHGEKRTSQSSWNSNKTLLILAAVAFVIMLFNQFQLLSISSALSGKPAASGVALVAASVNPTGVPRIYGKELKVSYDDVSAADPKRADATITVLGNLDRSLTLGGKDLERYVAIASQISCEYCCGANAIIFTKEDEDRIDAQIEQAISAGKIKKEEAEQYRQKAGGAACGCAHSFAMRGVAKYLIKNHGNEFTNEEILDELAKWKTLFFPGVMADKFKVMKEKGIISGLSNVGGYSKLGSNQYRGIEQGAAGSGGSMVGGC
ncbi:hypothetical protein HYS50_02510 [Candidatus Woesearchaeota archaeon]|nr:hypothetical protein [Candidatus Woesearchaeota archaeon]